MLKTVSNIKFADVAATKKRFLMLNRERLRRAEECMRPTQRDFLDFLPLLFHVNHPRLPGYVSKNTPAGICDFSPTKRALTAAKKYIQRFEYQKRALPRYDIVSMFLMGSSGTVAYSKKSDFDIWLCHQHDLSAERLADLQAKATAIEQWADAQGLEVHFFLMDPVRFKQGEIVDLSSESSGTAQYYLLLEEFYRTSLLLAGRFPIWWLVPVEEEINYDAYVQGLYQRRLAMEGECVDFGGIPTLPAEEFFRAALWQLFKGIDSPYKSVLKLLLMEVYASEYPNIDLLCLRFKRAIYDNEIDLDRLDPYLMLYRKLEEYLVRREEEERLELVRRCFYFKANQKLTGSAPVEYDWRRDMMRSLTNTWGWDEHHLEVMDSRAEWRIVRVLKERGVLVRELTYTYQFLSDFARQHAQLVAINQADLNALGRKLYAAFERKACKVEIVNRGISQNVWETVVSFYQIRQRGKEDGWAVLAGSPKPEEKVPLVALKRTRSLIEAMAWSHFNGLIRGSTLLKVVRSGTDIEDHGLEALERSLEKLFPRQMVLATNIEDLGRAVHVLKSAVIVNLGTEANTYHGRAGKHLASNRTDAFSYGGMYECLVESFDQVLVTSWKEVIASHHRGIDAILQSIGNYMKRMPPSRGVPPPLPVILCFSSSHKMAITQRIERLYRDIFDCFYGAPAEQANRFVFCVEHSYYVLEMAGDTLRHHYLASFSELLKHLEQGRQGFGQVVTDRYALNDTLLPLIYSLNKEGVVQCFLRDNGASVELFVIDERGALYYEKTASSSSDYILGHYGSFFDAVLQRQYYQLANFLDEQSDGIQVAYYRLRRDGQGQWQARRTDAHAAGQRRGLFDVQVLAQEGEQGEVLFTIYCGVQEFSSLEYGAELFNEVAAFILGKRQQSRLYPIFITDLDLPPSLFAAYGDEGVPTIEFLKYKREIEGQLNGALNRQIAHGDNVRRLPPA